MLKAGIIGLGHGSRVLIDAFRINKIKVYGITSKNYFNALKIGKIHNVKKIYKSWKQLINDKNIDIVAIAIPAYFQVEIIKLSLKKNKKVFCEKPIGTNYDKVNDLFDFAIKNKKFFFVDYLFEEHQAFLKFHKLLIYNQKHKIKKIEIKLNTLTYNNRHNIFNWKSNMKKGGGIVNLFFPHIIDYLVKFFGPINKIKCNIEKKFNREISAKSIFEFKSNFSANIQLNTNRRRSNHSIKVIYNNFSLILYNEDIDYGKNFKIIKKQNNIDSKKVTKNFSFNDFTKNFHGDTRKILTSKIIAKTRKKYGKKYNLANLERYKYNELVLYCIKCSIKKNTKIMLK